MKTIENQIKEMTRKERKAFLIDMCHHDLRYLSWCLINEYGDNALLSILDKLRKELRILKNIEKMKHPDICSTSIDWAVYYHIRE